ncbi:MAG: hypothetical protein FJ134_04370 [Deltaproteobacteria bacterium]|nr:hypothetical protein [Deltaproteobacteria bacterium]
MYPPEVLHALKDALKNAYWYKNDLRLFLQACEVAPNILAKQAWHDPQEYKIKIVSRVIDDLVSSGDAGLGTIRRLIKALLDIPSFHHLETLEDGSAKVSQARRAVEHLREIATAHDEDLIKRRAKQSGLQEKLSQAFDRRVDELSDLRARFFHLTTLEDHQQRGRLFEGFLYDLFVAHDLNPRAPFRIVGEQIDGAFEFEGTQFLLEAKWESSPLGAAPVDSFSKKVERKLENTLGLFLALNGFTEVGLAAIRGGRPSVILMDGQDLAIVLQGLFDLRDLLKRKIRHAAHSGDPFLRASEAYGGEA